MSASWTQKFYKEEINDRYKIKAEKTASEEWKELKEEISLKKVKKASGNLLKRWLKIFLITGLIVILLIALVYFSTSFLIKMKLN